MAKEITGKDIEALHALHKRWDLVIVADLSDTGVWSLIKEEDMPDEAVIECLQNIIKELREGSKHG